ncbi:acyl-CoA dehydrogenase/oxidase [Gongronella butleri]|nr:acyl-CoA dehydrogenase/oxidase [Gongronella butleri]
MNEIEPDLHQLGHRAITDLQVMGANAEDPNNYPRLRQYDAWCRRIDEISVSQGWKDLNDAACEEGMVAIAYERKYGEYSRIYQFAKSYLYSPSSAVYSCPLSMTDGAARVLELYGTDEMKKEIYPHLISRDPKVFWTSGQHMTERPGGSDVSRTETVAELVDAKTNTWKLTGFKWFSSATTADITVALARVIDPKTGLVTPGSKGLALFVAKMRRPDGSLNGVRVHRLKEKFGTKALPTAELEYTGMEAQMVGVPGRGVATIASVLNITRVYSAIGTVCALRRCLALIKDYARKRESGQRTLDKTPLHITTLAQLELTFRAGLQFSFYTIQLLGRTETRQDSQEDMEVLRLLTPIAKAYVCKIGTHAIAEAMEAMGGQGYMEEVGLGQALRNSIVNNIWEGTTNVLALDVLRVLQKSKGGALKTVAKVMTCKLQAAQAAHPASLAPLAQKIGKALEMTLQTTASLQGVALETSMRQITFALGRIVCAVLLLEQAAWSYETKSAAHDQDIAAVTQFVNDPAFDQPITARSDADILQDAKLVFGPNAKL